MKIEELKALIEEQIKAGIAPLLEVQRQHADALLASPPTPVPEAKGEQVEPGIRLARACKLMLLSKNDPERALFIAAGPADNPKKGMYPEDKELHAALKQMSAGTPSEGGYLVPEQYSAEVIPMLRAKAIVRRLGARSLPLTNGNLNIPKITGGATAYYLGESQNAAKSQLALGNLRLSGKKLVTLVPISNDLIRNNSYNADQMVRDDMVMTMALKEDYTALYGAGTEFTPIGVSNSSGITKVAKNALPTSDYLASLVGALLTKNLPWASVGWAYNGALWSVFYNLKDGLGNYLHRDEMNQGKLMGLPFVMGNQIFYGVDVNKKTDLFLGDWSEFIIGEDMALEIMASQEATYWDGTQLQSTFSRDETVIKVTAKHDFGLRHGEAFDVETDVYTV